MSDISKQFKMKQLSIQIKVFLNLTKAISIFEKFCDFILTLNGVALNPTYSGRGRGSDLIYFGIDFSDPKKSFFGVLSRIKVARN